MAREIANLTSVSSRPAASSDSMLASPANAQSPAQPIPAMPQAYPSSAIVGGNNPMADSSSTIVANGTPGNDSSLQGITDTTIDLPIDADSVFLGAMIQDDSTPTRGQAGVLQPAGQPVGIVKNVRQTNTTMAPKPYRSTDKETTL